MRREGGRFVEVQAAIGNDLANQRKAIGMQTRGGQTQQHVPVRHILELVGVTEPDENEDLLEPISSGKGDVPGTEGRLEAAAAAADAAANPEPAEPLVQPVEDEDDEDLAANG